MNSRDGSYDDILNAPRWNPRHHARMPMEDRAAQFAPFAALVGFEDVIGEVKARHEASFEERCGGGCDAFLDVDFGDGFV